MGRMMRVVVPVCLLLASIVAITGTEGAVSCRTVVYYLYPCIGYLASGGTIPNDSCCDGIRMIKELPMSASDLQDACGCVKSALEAVSFTPDVFKNAASLPAKCGVDLSYKIDPSTDCNSIN